MRFTKALLALAGVGVSIALAPVASANGPIPVVDESASICNTLSLVASGYKEWNNIEISMLQAVYDATRGEAVYAMQSAAESFCPEYASYAPVR